MANTSYFDLYKALKADGAVQGDWNSFHSFVGAQGKKGYENRKKLYDALKADGAVQAKTYEEFNMNLFRGGQASLRAAKQRRQQQAQRNAQPSARNTAAQQVDSGVPMTAAQRALQMSAGGTDYMRNWQLLHKRDDQMTPTERIQASNMRGRMQEAQEKAYKNEAVNPINNSAAVPNSRSFNETMHDLNTPKARRARAIQQRKDDATGMAAYEVTGNEFTHNNGSYSNVAASIDPMVAPAMKEADDLSWSQYQEQLKAAGGDAYLRDKAWKDLQDNRIKNRQEVLAKNLSAKLTDIYSERGMQEHIIESADKLNMGVEEYVDKYVTPQIMNRAQEVLNVKNIEEVMPKSSMEYVVKRLSDSILGTLSAGQDKSKDQRLREQQAMAIADDLEEMPRVTGYNDKKEYYRSGVGTRFVSTAANMAMDSPILGMTGGAANVSVDLGKQVLMRGLAKVGIVKAGAKLTAEQLGFKIANMTMAQKIGSGLLEGTAKGALNLGGYSAITGALGQASTGDDTSLSALAQAGWEGFKHGATTGAMFGASGAVMAPWVQKYGINGMETTRGERWLHGAQKVGATAVGLGVEAGTMMVADNITGDKEISVGQWLEDVVMVGAFKAGEPKNYGRIGQALYGLTHNTSSTFRFGKDSDGNWRSVDIRLTDAEKEELVNSTSGKDLMDAFASIDKARKISPMNKTAYTDFMKDPDVSQSTKEKVNAAMGLFNTTRKRSYRSVNDVKNKQILEYAQDGTLLTRTSYKNAEERRAVLYRQNVYRDNEEMLSLVGYAMLKDREYLDKNGMITKDALDFLTNKGYDISKDETDPKNAKLIADMKDESSELHKLWVENRMSNSVLSSKESKEAIEILKKDPMKRTNEEAEKLGDFKTQLETQLFPDGVPHPVQSQSQGRAIAEEEGLGTEKPNPVPVVTELRTLKQAEEEMAQLMNSNDVFSENFNDLQKKGLTHPQIYDWMIQNGLTEDDLLPYAKYMNQVARVQGMQDTTAKAIEENVGAFVQDWTFHGTMDGQEANGENALWVKDKDGRTLLVGSGDVAYDPTTGRAKEGVGDMLVCLDPNTGEMVYVRAEDTTLFDNKPASDLEAFRRQQLQEINSAPYNQAAQEQAAADAAKPQQEGAAEPENKVEQPQTAEIGSEPIVNSIVNDGKGGTDNMGNTLNSDGSIHTEKVNTLDEIKDDEFDEPTRSVELPEIPDNVATAIGSNGKPIIIKKNIFKKNATNHPELDASDSRAILNEALYNPNLVGQTQPVKRPSYKVAIKTGDKNSIVVLDVYDDKKQVEIVGWRRINEKGLAKMQRQAEREGGQFLILSPNDGSAAALSALPHDLSSVGKDTNNSSNGNGVNTTLTFKDGSAVPVDANGEPDFMNMTPEQGAEVYKTLFPKTYEAEVDSAIKMLDKDLKNAQKATPKSKGVMARAKEQADIEAAINLAEEQLAKAQAIKKALTAEKVAETMAKPEGEKPTEEANKASGAAAEKFQNAPRLVGNKRTRTLPNNEKVKGHYEIVPAESLTPSHDAMNGYKKSDGFPVDSEGRTINDRDYENDKSAQQNTDQIALKYNGQAIEQVPVVSDEGIVYDGNGRTMAGQKAAKDGTDAEYINDLMDNAENFGFTREQIEQSGIEHPRLVMVTDERMPYTTDTFAKFNRNEKKTQSNTEQAVAKAKTLSADEVGAIVAEIEGNGSLEAFFNNPNAINSLIKTLQEKDIIGQNEVAELMEGNDRLSPQGKEMVKNILLGSIFKPETIRMLGVDSAIKNKAVAAIRSVMDNLKLGDYSLRDEIDSAIQLLYEARRGDNKVDTLLRTPEFFGESAADRYPSISQMMALALEGKVSDFRDLINEYNRVAAARNTGEGDMFGDTPTKEELIRDFLEYKKWKDYETRGNQEAERSNDAEGVRKTEPEAQGGNGEKQAESQREVDEADYIDGKDETPKTAAEKKKEASANPMEKMQEAANDYKQEQIDKAAEAYKEAKESGDEEQTTKAAKNLKHLMDESYKEKGYSLAKRQSLIAKVVGKKEAEIIDKPLNEMDSEELEFVASKNPLTESEIREQAPDEDRNFIEDAVDYVNGNHGFAQKLAYLKIYKDVRSGHENAASDSGAEDGAQLAPADNGSGEGLGLGTGRESGGPAGQLDRGAGNEPASRERESGESGKNDSAASSGEPSDKQGEGDTSRLGDVPTGGTESKGGSGTGKDGDVSQRGGRKGSGGSAAKNAKRKPTAKQGTTWRGRSGEEIKKNVEEKKAAALAAIAQLKKLKYGKGGSGNLGSMELMTPEQMEYLPTVANAIKDYGMAIIDEGIYKIKDWVNRIRETFKDGLMDCGFTESEVDRFIKEMWNSKMEMDGETHTIADWCAIYEGSTLRKKLSEVLDEKRQKQMDAEPIEVKVGDRKNIEETLPYLLPQQQEDVYRAETQFFGKEHADRDHAYGKGYMFTNGTGTGKTYTGLGIIKRLTKQGKGRILIVTPSGQKVKDWSDDGKNLNLNIKSLEDWAKERGTNATSEVGEGCVITTFANFGLNKKLLEVEWDAVIYDESHRIMENKDGKETARSMQHYKVTNRNESHCFSRLQEINPHYQKIQDAADRFAKQREAERKKIVKEYKASHPSATERDANLATSRMMPKDLNSFAPADGQTFPKLGKIYNEFTEAKNYYYNNVKPKLEKQAKDTWKNTKTVFLSATPFNTRENLDYAEGYIFKYPKEDESGMSGRTRFYLDHFGAAYKYRYHRLEQNISNPDAVAKQEIAFSDYLQHNLGTMSGRIIDSPYDYSRDFPTVAPDHAEAFNDAVQECLNTRYLHGAYSKTIGDYNYGSALFETMKVANTVNRIKEHLAAGRKVVIYHRRVETKEPIRPPFEYMLDEANRRIAEMKPGKERNEFIAEVTAFRNKYQDLLQWEQTLDYSMPREQLAKVFGKDNVLFFSGKEGKKVKENAIKNFNDDDSGKNILVIQEASGKEGISLQDKTGKHQRVVITLALPQSPITALQIEGRIYRIGNMSNAIFEYPILGLNSEMMLFGQKFNNQVSTTENLALGSQARNLRDSFAKGILEHSGIVPIDQQGVGGKAFDAPKQEGESDPFDDAVLDYYSNQKLNKNNRQGVDYFPTPEPLGYKMVQWAGLADGDSVLEPSAGHGAIARYVPKSNELVSIEPNQSLFSRLQLKVGNLGRKFLNNTFENYAISNKHDAIIMNPPFGKAGATAIQHVDKAFRHLDEGGRLVALIPRGSMDKKFEDWIEKNKDAVVRAEVNLPDITFQQAGTGVRTRVVVLDKVSDATMREKAGRTEVTDLSGNYDKVEDFFEDLRNVEMPDRIIDTKAKMMKKSRQGVKDIRDIKGVAYALLDKEEGVTVRIKGDWRHNYHISFQNSDNPDMWKRKMASYYKEYDELGKSLTANETKQAVFDEMKKLTCKLADMTEEEMQRFIKNADGSNTTHFREERGVQYSKTDEKDVKNSRIIPEDVDKSVSLQIEKKFDEDIEHILSSCPQSLRSRYERLIDANIRLYGLISTKKISNEVNSYEALYKQATGGTGKSSEVGNGDSSNDAFYRTQYLLARAAANRELDYRADRRKNLESLFGLKSGERLTYENVDRVFEQSEGAKDEGIRALYEKAKAINNRLGTDIEGEFVDEEGTDFLGDSSTGRRISLFIDALTRTRTGGNELGITLVHEMLHQATTGAIHLVKSGKADGVLTPKQVEGVKEILKLYDEVKGDKERFKEKDYGLQSVYEFVAQMADPRQRKALSRLGAAKSELGKKENNILKRFVNAIKKLFQITSDKSKMDSAINKIMDDFNKNSDDFAMNDIEQNNFAYKVADKDELDRLNKEKTFRMYSGMQELDGKLYSPMAAIIDGKRTDATEIGAWMRSDERPDLVKGGKFTLVKTDKSKGAGEGDVDAAYNPYMHTSTSMMNDQFTGAYARGNIKVVEWDIPESEKTSGYHAEGAKNSVGLVPWHSGSVNGLLPKDRQRSVMLSRWRKAVRVVPDSEVAESIANQLKGTGLAIPWNVVTPNQLRELAKLGVPITTKESGTQSPDVKAKFNAQMEDLKKEFPQAKFVDVKMTKDAHKEWGKNGGTHFREDRSSEDLYNSLNDKQNNKKEYNGTVTELANRVKQGTARIVREGEGAESSGSVNRRESLPAIAGKILNAANKQGDGQSTGLAGEASDKQGEKVLHLAQVYGQIEQWAKENGCYFTEDDIAKDSLDGKVWNDEGVEATIYRSKDGKSVIKVMSIDNYYNNAIDYYLDRNNHFNEVFPDTAIEVVGYGRDSEGRPSIIYKQPLVEGKTVYDYFNGDDIKANEYIDNMLAEMGYDKKVAHDDFGLEADSNGKYNLFDVNYRNVIIDKDGKPHVIDAEVLPVDYKNDGKVEIKDTDSSHFRNDESAVSIADDAPLVVKHVDKIAKQVGGKVKMVASPEEVTNKEARERIERGENVTGWYDEKTGEVHLYMPNIHDRYTAEKTIWHEVVGHKGMRELIGEENYSNFLRGLWYDLDRPENARLKELVSEELKYNPLDFENGIEEGIARLVEDGKGEPGFWNNIKNKVTDMLHEIGYRVAPNTKDVKYLLWLAKNMQKHPNDLTWKMRAEAVRYKLSKENVPAMIDYDGVFYGNDGKGHSFDELTKKDFEAATDGQIHFRTTPSAATALDRYHKSLDKHGYMFTESYMDNMLSLKNLMQAIEPNIKNIADIKSSENPYILQNTMQGAMSNAAQMFERNVMKPLDKAMAGVLDAFEGKNDEAKIKNFNLYMITKHGLERNRVLFVRDYITGLEKDDADILRKQWNAEKKDLDDRLRNGTIDLKDYYEEMDEWIRNNVDDSFVAGDHDYSGIHAIQEVEKDSDPYDDNEAIASVMDAEANMESLKKGSTKDFWDKVKAATQYALDCDYKNGLMDKELYGHVSDMFNWYVPLRKYDEKTAEDTYGYITEKGDPKNFIGKTIMRAKGRKSLSETNVLAQIGAMGNRAINNGGQNAIKQAFARFIRSHSDNNLVTETSVWYVDDPKTQTTTERYPEIPDDATPDEINQIVSDFNAEMMDLESKGLATKKRRRGSIGYRFQKAENKSQHLVDVMIAGKKHTFVVNGNPRAAQALNGLLENSSAKGIMKPLGSISRLMAQLCTSFNPEFVMRNIMRDAEFASSNVTAKEGARYGGIWAKYYAQLGLYKGASNISLKDLSGSTGLGLFAKYRNGTLDMNDKVQRYFKEFMENGGETGWVQIKNMKEWEKQYKEDVKGERSKVRKNGKMLHDFFFGNLENLNEVAENIARFSTYCASRDYGRSIVRSTYDAKEVSTNFNRHGSGDAIKSFKNGEMSTGKAVARWGYGFTSSYLRHCSMFFNAGIQSTNLLVKNLKTNPVGTGVNMLAIPFALGALAALGNNALIASEDEKDRKGVKDPYGEMPDYIRRNNLCIYKGGGEFVTIPLAIELRAFYGLGDLAAGLTFSPNVSGQKNPFFDAVGSISQLVPMMDYLGNSSAGKDPIGETIKAITPSAISPFVEWEMNSDWKGSPIERRGDYNKNVPAWQRAYNGTPEILKTINKYVNAATNDVAKGNEDMLGNGFLDMVTNPSMLNHYFGGIGGGAATFSERLLGAIKHGKDTETKDIPFVRSLLYTPSEQTSLQRTKSKWYNYKDELETTMANVSRLKSKNVPIDKRLTNIADYYNFQNSSDAAKVRIIDLAEKQMNRWKKMRDRASDTESVNFANQNIDRIMMETVEELDRME